MMLRSRFFTVLTTASYLLVISGAALFHDHSCGCDHDHESPRAGVSAGHFDDAHPCPVCQYLSQKTAPAEVAASDDSATLVQNVASPALPEGPGQIFSAWQSRAPPAFA